MSSQLSMIVAAIEANTGKKARSAGNGYRVVCPLHGKSDANLSVGDGDGKVLLHCHSHHCDPKDILESLGFNIRDIYHEQLNPQQSKHHAIKAQRNQIRESLQVELLILLQSYSDFYKDLYTDQGADGKRVRLAVSRIGNAMDFFKKEGIS